MKELTDITVNQIIAEFMGYSYCACEGDDRENFIKGCIVDDREYDEELCPTGGSIVLYSEDLYTESMTYFPEVLSKLNTKITIDPTLKETVPKSLAYQVAKIIEEKFN